MARRNIVWFRRDLRVGDHPALNAAIAASDEIVPVFILDKTQIAEAGEKLLAYMGQSLRALDESLGNCLHIIEGDQVEVLQELIEMYGASEVHISDEYERYGATRDARVAAAGIPLVRTGSPYAVAPGRVVKPSDGTPYKFGAVLTEWLVGKIGFKGVVNLMKDIEDFGWKKAFERQLGKPQELFLDEMADYLYFESFDERS